MHQIYTQGLTLNKTETVYLTRLLKHNWLYPLCNSNMEYRQAKLIEQRLVDIAETKRGNYLTLFQRVESRKRQYRKYREVKHRFIAC